MQKKPFHYLSYLIDIENCKMLIQKLKFLVPKFDMKNKPNVFSLRYKKKLFEQLFGATTADNKARIFLSIKARQSKKDHCWSRKSKHVHAGLNK